MGQELNGSPGSWVTLSDPFPALAEMVSWHVKRMSDIRLSLIIVDFLAVRENTGPMDNVKTAVENRGSTLTNLSLDRRRWRDFGDRPSAYL